MPGIKESSYPEEWLEKALKDFKRVQARLKENDTEDAAFHLQQAIEKALKAFLLSKNWPLKKIHDLEALLDDAIKYDPSLRRFRPLLQQVTGYYLIDRYPTIEEGPSRDELRRAFQQSKRLMAWIEKEV